MAVWVLACPSCGHEFPSLVLAGTRVPSVWVCGKCGSRDAQPRTVIEDDPLTSGHGPGCACG